MTSAGLSIGVDIGGTFTDCTIMHDGGRIATGKSPTTPDDRSRGFFEAIASAAAHMGSTLESVMERCDLLVHGTTTGTNAIVERRGAPTGLLTTRGHDDAMFIMKGQGRTSGLSPDEALDVHSTYRPEPLVPRAMVRPITERVDVDGEVIVPLDEGEVRDAVRELVAAGATALTISFLWSTMNSVHEQRAREIAAEVAPELFISCGSELSSRTGEFERTTTAVMNSYIGPLMVEYVDRIHERATRRFEPSTPVRLRARSRWRASPSGPGCGTSSPWTWAARPSTSA
jgi:N-methylhydantoinase A